MIFVNIRKGNDCGIKSARARRREKESGRNRQRESPT